MNNSDACSVLGKRVFSKTASQYNWVIIGRDYMFPYMYDLEDHSKHAVSMILVEEYEQQQREMLKSKKQRSENLTDF